MSVDIATPQPWAAGPRVGDEEDRDRKGHAGDAGRERHQQLTSIAQLTEVELAARLEPDDEEEERHQALADPVAQRHAEPDVADLHRQREAPDSAVRPEVDARPDHGGDDCGQQDAGAGGFGAQEPAELRGDAPRPDGVLHRCRVRGDRVAGIARDRAPLVF
nr:hypothetical protein [Pseudolysinimonas kribbensis]